MKGIIDRFEEDIAVIEREDNTMINIERSRLPKEAVEGDVIIIKDDSIIIDKQETTKRKKKIDILENELFK
ncbi:DUF3006 domain-containing protein [Caldisalinibacter kiritimatiensis]|uniref:Uncharacterized protein n=1 Tax=Caldisalinibacter kiritimatiensis TaxID=1304284 RepID=R1AXI1_9FIRM|nr:DUF3006 domain-containing protein [Caldisalinibacter kiritimatiensis]EOD01362.1 hypothetical protein L21TH_0583 [Caldisalinibacter kiritimatiensis]